MISLKKVAAVTLAASVMLSMAACGKKKEGSHSGKKIDSNMPWYEVTSYDIDIGIVPDKEIENAYTEKCGLDDDYIILKTQGNYKRPDDFDETKDNYNDYQLSTLSIVDRKAKKTLKTADLTTLFGTTDFVENISYSDGKIYLNITGYDPETYEATRKKVTMDVKTLEILDSAVLEASNASLIGSYKIGNHTVESFAEWGENATQVYLNVTSPDGETKKIDFSDVSSKIDYIQNIIPLSDKMALIMAYFNGSPGVIYMELDLDKLALTSPDKKKYEWLDTVDVYGLSGFSDGNSYVKSTNGIEQVDFNKKTQEELVNFSWCNYVKNAFDNLQVADVKDGTFLLCGESIRALPYGQRYFINDGGFHIFELKAADKNPHEGKTIIELHSSYGYLSEELARAVLKFNEKSTEYFIEVTDRYTPEITYDYSVVDNADDAANASLKYRADLSSKLAMDIMNGDGPDMLLNVDHYHQLKNDNYLADLSSLVSGMSKEKYFTNVLDISKVDGKLYHVPLSFAVIGIQTDPKYAPTTGTGFTTDEYSKFVKDAMNGKDVIMNGQAQYFGSLFSNMTNSFIKNGKADFSGPEFAALAEYVKDNVPERIPDDNEMMEEYDGMKLPEVVNGVYGAISTYSDYISNVEATNGCTDMLGLPSIDGRGPAISFSDSISVSAQSKYKDACIEFIKILISDDTQKELASQGYFVLNRDSFRDVGKKATDYFNKTSIAFPFGYYGNGQMPKNRVTFSNEHIKALEKTIESCSSYNSEDPAITLILVEEMPAYFSGQKSLDAVIKIAQDRVQKVLDERK
jgi:hypothetical protein